MGLDTTEVCFQQNIGDLLALLFGEAVALKYLDTECVQGFVINVMVLHINYPP